MCCAWIAELLMAQGYKAGEATTELVRRWSGAPAAACVISKSVDYLRRSAQLADLDFILSHVNDLSDVYCLSRGEVHVLGRPAALIQEPESIAAAEAKVA